MSINPKVSISIATYEADGKGLFFIKKNVESFLSQTYENLELVISDHSINYDIKNYIDSLNNDKIIYVRNEKDRGLQVENINNAILNCSGDYVKLINHDDYMESPKTIELMVNLLDDEHKWVISSCKHLNYETKEIYNFHNPRIESDGTHLLSGLNYVGCPSVGLIPNGVLLDTNVKYMGDCELWFRLFKDYGMPSFLGGHNVVIGMGNHTLTRKFASKHSEMLRNDIIYCKEKYNIT